MTKQLAFPQVAAHTEVNGIDMGVLEDGTAYLSGRGLARMCGVAPSAIIEQAKTWSEGGRTNKLATQILAHGYEDDLLYIPTEDQNGTKIHAYPDVVCMAFLEYYAFEANTPSEVARHRYRLLARQTLRTFIYRAVGYDPNTGLSRNWQHFHDRLKLHDVPLGYFSVFKEIADIVLAAIKGGLLVDHHTVPDISVGKAWAEFWVANRLSESHGERIHHPHFYPDYYPQAASNPQEIWVYPLAAVGEFRMWMQREYLPQKFPIYLTGRVKKGAIQASDVAALLKEILPPEALPPGEGGDA